MIIYNVTIKIDLVVHDEWLTWMKEKHIPDVMDTNLFTGHKIGRLLDQDESEGKTYAIQYYLKDMSDYNHYLEKFALKLQAEHLEKFKDHFVAFRTLMEEV